MIGSKHSCDHVESSTRGPARHFLTARVKEKKNRCHQRGSCLTAGSSWEQTNDRALLQKCKFIYWISISVQGYKDYLYMIIDQFSADCISKYLSAWEKLNSNPEVLQTLKGIKLEFEKNVSEFSVGHETPTGQQLWFIRSCINFKKGGCCVILA